MWQVANMLWKTPKKTSKRRKICASYAKYALLAKKIKYGLNMRNMQKKNRRIPPPSHKNEPNKRENAPQTSNAIQGTTRAASSKMGTIREIHNSCL